MHAWCSGSTVASELLTEVQLLLNEACIHIHLACSCEFTKVVYTMLIIVFVTMKKRPTSSYGDNIQIANNCVASSYRNIF